MLKVDGTVTAADIQADSDIEILNPDLHIATLESDAHFRMRLTARTGRGYNPADANKREDQPIGVLPIDSIYTPVTRVSYYVENTRVGQMTNYDKLTLDVWTDGSIEPERSCCFRCKDSN